MTEETLAERIHALQVSLKDGDDLARAIGLIGDALQRRMQGIRSGLEALKEDGEPADGPRLDSIVERVRDTLDRYEDQIETRRARMEELVREFQSSLGDQAQQLDEIAVDLGGEPMASNGDETGGED